MLMKIDSSVVASSQGAGMESGGSSAGDEPQDMTSPHGSRGSISPPPIPLQLHHGNLQNNRHGHGHGHHHHHQLPKIHSSYSPPHTHALISDRDRERNRDRIQENNRDRSRDRSLDRGSPFTNHLMSSPPSSVHQQLNLSVQQQQHMINSIAASKNMTPGILASLSALGAMSSAAAVQAFGSQIHPDHFGSGYDRDRMMDRGSYGHSPPAPMAPTNDPTANECKLVDYRGQKVAAFVISGDTMLCLPQAFELFLKHLVGGLHTVYTKLKRLDIVPIVCNVEQVRILRGLGAIQPGVNRCKLLSCKDFDILYKDCTTASSRPGRPPKRTSVPLVGGLGHGGFLMKKHRLENGDYPPYESPHPNHADVMRLEKSPLLANGYNHPPMHLLPGLAAGGSAAAAAQLAAHAALFSPSALPPPNPRDCRSAPLQSLDAAMAARNANAWETCRTAYEDFVKQFESRYQEDCSDSEKSSHANETGSGEAFIRNGNLDGSSPVLNLSKNTTDNVSDSEDENGGDEEEFSENEQQNQQRSGNKFPSGHKSVGQMDELDDGDIRDEMVKNSEEEPRNDRNDRIDHRVENRDRKSPGNEENDHRGENLTNLSNNLTPLGHRSHELLGLEGSHFSDVAVAEAAISSTENLLRNIQGLLKVAADNAKQQERRVNLEKAEFKMELIREREIREQMEKQLVEERNLRIYYEKRWKKERRFRKKLEDTSDLDPLVQTNQNNQINNNNSQQNSNLTSNSTVGVGGQILNNFDKTSEKCPSVENAKSSGPCSTNGSLKGELSDR